MKNKENPFLIEKEKKTEFLKYLSLAGQLGFVMISSILIWFFLIRYLVIRFQLSSVWLSVGIILGIATGMISSYRLLKRLIDKDKND